MTTKAQLISHYMSSRENLTEQARSDINNLIDIFWDDIYSQEYETQEEATAAISEGAAAIVAVVDSWAWSQTEDSKEWVYEFLSIAVEVVKPVAKEFVKIGLKVGMEALKGGLS